MAYWLIASLLTIPETIAGLILAPVSFSFLKWQINMHEQLLFFFKKSLSAMGRQKPVVISLASYLEAKGFLVKV